MKRSATRFGALLLGAVVALSPLVSRPAAAAVSLTVAPITWDVVGLDSNTPASGPFRFPVGARVCATGTTDATGVTAVHTWDSANPSINLRPGSLDTVDLGRIAAGTCEDAYFEAEVTTTATAYDTFRRYHITATADGGASASTPRPRQLYVEHLISQNRNGITSVSLDGTPVPAGGSMTLVVGQTYEIELAGYTATQGYNQLEAFITLSNTVFQVLGVQTTYTANTSPWVGSPDDRLYADACGWDSDPGSPNYRSCVGGDYKAGGTVVTTYRVRILSGAGTAERLTSLLYDFSGSSFHYNADSGTGYRIANIVGPEQVTIAKAFTPRAVTPGATSTLTFRLTNPTGQAFTGVNFADDFPAGMEVANPAGVSYAGCGAGAFSPAPSAGDASVSFANGTIGANGVCTITVAVTAPEGVHDNTTDNLFIDGTVDTGNRGSDTLTVTDGATCTPGQTIATWTVPDGTTANPPDLVGGTPTTKAAGVGTTTAVASVPARTAISTAGGQGDTTAWRAYGFKDDGQALSFVVDTSKYSDVAVEFYAANPSTANGPTAMVLEASTGGAFGALGTWANPPAGFTQYTASAAGQTSTSGNTTFRITPSGAKVNTNGGSMDFDAIAFTGCRLAAAAPTLAKSFAPDPIAVGATSTLTFTIANTAAGNVAQTGIAFSDVLPVGLEVADTSTTQCGGTVTTTASTRTIALSGGTLAAGGTCTINAAVTGSAAGTADNVTGFLSSSESGTTTSYATDSLTVVAPPVLAKAFDATAIRTGETTRMRFTVTNPNRSTTLTGIGFNDTMPAGLDITGAGGSTCGGTLTVPLPDQEVHLGGVTLAPNTSCEIWLEVTGTAEGALTNTTTAVTSTEGGSGDPASADIVINDPSAVIELNKQVSTTPLDATSWRKAIAVEVGDAVSFRFSVYNAGDVAFSSIAVDDGGPVTCTWTGDPLPLAPGGTASCVIGPVTAASGLHTNTATATGTSILPLATSQPSTASYATTGLTIVKSATEATFTAAGDVLHYEFLVTNTGFYPLQGPVTVSDDRASDESCPAVDLQGDLDTYLDPGESITCTATYTVTAGDVTAGSVTNVATASAGGITSPSDDATVPYLSPAALTISKTATEATFTAAGDVLHYSFLVSNSGGVGLAGPVSVSDDKASDETCPPVTTVGDLDATLDPGESITCTATYTVSSDDVTAKHVTNSASATADRVTSNTDTATVDLAALAIAKDSTTTEITAAGQVVPYEITVTNTGGSTLTNPAVADSLCSSAPTLVSGDTGGDAVFAAGEAWVYACSHTVTQAEMNIGSWITNTATATTDQTAPRSATRDIDVTQAPLLEVAKSSATTAIDHAGQVVPFTITAHNAGNVDLTSVLVQDVLCDASPVYQGGDTADVGVLNVGETWTYTCSRTMTQLDIDIALAGIGIYTNEASVTTHQTGKVSDGLDIPVTRDAALTITKVADPTATSVTGPIDYAITITNTGNSGLSNVIVGDTLTGGAAYVSGDTSNPGVLDVGEIWLYHATYAVTQADLDAGDPIVNTATVVTDQTASQSASATTTITRQPGLAVAKTSTTTSRSPRPARWSSTRSRWPTPATPP